MKELLGRRVQDGVIARLVAKWLKAAVWKKGQVSYPEQGTPQGAVISPLLRVTGNYRMLEKLRWEVAKLWRTWLGRRHRGRPPSWDQLDGLLRVFPLIPETIVHSIM